MGEDRGGGARHPRGGMAELLGPSGGAGDASPQVSRQPHTRDLGEEVGGGAPVGWEPDLQTEEQDTEEPETRQHSCWEHQEACLAVLPGEDGALLNRTVPPLDEEPTHPPVLVVPVPVSDSGAPLQGVPGMKGPTEDPVGGGEEGDQEVQEPVEDPGSTCRWEVQSGGAGFPHYYKCWENSADCGRRRRE